jgi:hypothetical protein
MTDIIQSAKKQWLFPIEDQDHVTKIIAHLGMCFGVFNMDPVAQQMQYVAQHL